MVTEMTLENYLKALVAGNRNDAAKVIEATLKTGTPVNQVYLDIIWPTMVKIEKLRKKELITPTQQNMAVRINRTFVDQLQNKLPRRPLKNKKAVVCCAPNELRELGGQILADLFESDGWEVKFIGGGLSNEDVLIYVNEFGPDTFIIYGSEANQAPAIRQLIDLIKRVNAWPEMKIMLSGGLFERVEGLWEEIGADLCANNAQEALQLANNPRVPEGYKGRTLNRRKKQKEQV
jgi:methanogenic corrinoid protein MtbC1